MTNLPGWSQRVWAMRRRRGIMRGGETLFSGLWASGRPPSPPARVAERPNPLSYLRRLCLRVASAAVESRLSMSSGALP